VNKGCWNSRFFTWLGLSLAAISLLLSCGCGGSTVSSTPTQAQAPTALSYSPGTAIYTQLTPITANSPTSTGGAVTSYSVTPPLPGGLFLSPSTGVVSGTPTSVSAATIYTVTASNSAGSATAPLTITVSVAAPIGLEYSTPTAYYTVGVPIPENIPTCTGGAPTTYGPASNPTYAYSVSPPLPAGLHLSTSAITLVGPATGIISGTPTVATPATTYAIIASNSSGSTTATLTITVSAVDASVAPPNWNYSAPAPVYVAATAIAPNTPSLTPAGETTYSISPALSSGLTFSASTGAITGTPAAIPSTIVPPPPVTIDYTVTATGPAGGSTTAPLTITLYNAPQSVPNMGQSITPLATAGSSFQFLDTGMIVTDPIDAQVAPAEWLAGQAVSSAVSPDGSTLLVLTSGFNRVYQGPFPLFDPLMSNEYVFIYDITNHSPVFKQAVPIPNAYHGLVWDPIVANHAFYVSGGMGDAPFGRIRFLTLSIPTATMCASLRRTKLPYFGLRTRSSPWAIPRATACLCRTMEPPR
jgi:hypothetical protein